MRFVVAFASPKRSARIVEVAAQNALAFDAELILLRIIAPPEKVGVVAQLISSERPQDKAQQQIDEVVGKLKERGVKASGLVRSGEVAKTLSKICSEELNADLIFVGTRSITKKFFLMEKDPIVNYLVNNCPTSLYLVRHGPLDVLDDPTA